jgi:hypothetical protein
MNIDDDEIEQIEHSDRHRNTSFREEINELQIGGFSFNPAVMIPAFFSADTYMAMKHIVRSSLKTGLGAGAIAATGGAGGDVIVNSAFAVQSSLGFSKDTIELVNTMNEMRDLFNHLFYFTAEKIPLRSKLLLDMGLDQFKDDFLLVLRQHIGKYDTITLDKVYQKIISVMDRLTTVLSDWLSTLFPDTAGLVGELAKKFLDHVVRHGFTYTYNLISIIPPNMQEMLTNPYALKEMIRKAIDFLEKILTNLNPADMANLLNVIALQVSKVSTSTGNILKYGANFANQLAKYNNFKFPSIVDGTKLIKYVLDTYIRPNIDFGVDLFDQLLPIYFMFVLYMEEYPIMRNKFIEQKK